LVTLDDVTPDGARLLFDFPGESAKGVFVVPYEWIVSVWWNGNKVAIQVAAHITVGGGLVRGFPVRW
jgi:hypothetical protein